ncbi:hypothetical protein IX321_000929 [Bacteroides pyogenes]|nr:hypothetical protein [Bacteroides pyogenes]MBR8717210.1 hypothetical protein [Bacteroides pyogenes]MBR8746516.1 hypothetical protein [Bacteroides pyogenes]MBR8756788.1 hypothetical protein [Bacteroides pyogenes]MBR8780030.1 hypothetical protein [Bacteroides pyogenes]
MARSTFKVLFYMNGSKEKDGIVLLMGRVTINSTVAHFNGKIPRNLFAQFHVNPNTNEREFLSEDELKILMAHEFADSHSAFVRDLFVFAPLLSCTSSTYARASCRDRLFVVSGKPFRRQSPHFHFIAGSILAVKPCLS